MTAYIVRRLLWLPFLLLIISFFTFALALYGPGDPVLVQLGGKASPETVARIRKERGLDRPFLIQYGDYILKALHGDFGESYRFPGQPVGALIARRIWVSVQLGFAALVFALTIGVPLGLLAALLGGTIIDRLIVAMTLAANSFPTFVTAPILLWLFARQLRILPAGGWDGLFSPRVILPVIVLGMGGIAVFARQTRASLLDVLPQDYIRTARAKGLHELVVLIRHAMRNAMMPLVTIVGLSLGGLVEGAFITENLFGIPGIGALGFDAFISRDYPVILALTLVAAVSYTLANLLTDIAYAFIDPRIRYERRHA
jgi:peptide/nickel transport system permease protein